MCNLINQKELLNFLEEYIDERNTAGIKRLQKNQGVARETTEDHLYRQ